MRFNLIIPTAPPPITKLPNVFRPISYAGYAVGGGGAKFDDSSIVNDITIARLVEIRVRWAQLVDAIQLVYRCANQTIVTPWHGGSGGSESVFYLAPGESIVKVEGRSESLIDRLQFFTNLGENDKVEYSQCLIPANFPLRQSVTHLWRWRRIAIYLANRSDFSHKWSWVVQWSEVGVVTFIWCQ